MNRELSVAVEAARAAGEAILAVYRRPDVRVVEKSGDRGPLTEADLASNAILHERLLAAFPDDAILSEESRDNVARLTRSRVWIIDPLDGTREFTLGIDEFAVSIGLAIDGRARVGVVFNPATGELFTGVVGSGATYDGRSCYVSRHDQILGARFLVSRSEHEKGWFARWEGVAEMKPTGSVAYKFGLVAAGKAEATFTPKPRNEWDLLGGVACVLAAGGHASDGAGASYGFNSPSPLKMGVCGSNGALHGAVLGLMGGHVDRADRSASGPP